MATKMSGVFLNGLSHNARNNNFNIIYETDHNRIIFSPAWRGYVSSKLLIIKANYDGIRYASHNEWTQLYRVRKRR